MREFIANLIGLVVLALILYGIWMLFLGIWIGCLKFGYYSFLFFDVLLQVHNSLNPLVAWAVLGLILGGATGLWKSAKKNKVPYIRIYAIAIPFVFLTIVGTITQPWRSRALEPRKLSPEFKIKRIEGILVGALWRGNIGTKEVELQFDPAPPEPNNSATYFRLEVLIRYKGGQERMAGEITKDGRLIIKETGQSVKKVFYLHTLNGKLSSDARSISGFYLDSRSGLGKWFVSRTR